MTLGGHYRFIDHYCSVFLVTIRTEIYFKSTFSSTHFSAVLWILIPMGGYLENDD